MFFLFGEKESERKLETKFHTHPNNTPILIFLKGDTTPND
jgi:hypothetical protein